MAKDFDILNPQISTVAKGLEGKTLLVYGSNSTGKTKQATRASKPFYLPFEPGINTIAGIPNLPIHNKWSNFKKINKQLTNPKTLDEVRSKYSTIIFDTVSAASQICQDYICELHGVSNVSEGNRGYGLWKEYETEFWREINKLTSVGYTVYFISHEGERKFHDEKGEEYSKIYPTGDKRSIDPIINLCDIVLYLKPNGIDLSTNQEILSSAFMVNTPQYLARSRFDYMIPSLKEFTIENLEKAIKDAIIAEEKHSGTEAIVSYEEQKESQQLEEKDFDTIVQDIKEYAIWLHEKERRNEYDEIIQEYLGKNGSVAESTKNQQQQLEMILYDLELEFKEEMQNDKNK